MITLKIANDFSRHPAGRFVSDGPYSGQLFREHVLEQIIRNGERTIIDLDGARGYGSSFLEEAFGGLARKHPLSLINSLITFKSRDQNLIDRIELYMKNANNTTTKKKSLLFGGGLDVRSVTR
ncbi:STAS-like domain-containing protein [Pseudomonas sp. D47]|uniref:STAS-like domain-containing protein n=1 Tax=Pseudomonas sp. D47 TaxID=3159447 RepID=UPI00387AF0F6